MEKVRPEIARKRVSRNIRDFYQKNPFPGYDLSDFPTFESLKSHASAYIRMLDQSIDSDAAILEAGCGTGQLSNYLAHISTRRVVAVDFSHASLALGRRLRDQLRFDNLKFLQADLFGLPFPENSFDFVLCHGVLHHTPEPSKGLGLLARLLKPGGGLVIGLYHRMGRRGHWKKARRIRKDGETAPESIVRYRPSAGRESPETTSSWFADMYLNPYETGHLLSEAVGWLEENGLIVTGSVPSFEWGSGTWNDRSFFDGEGLSRWDRNRLTYMINDLLWWIKPVERGYFLLFGRKE